MSSLGLIPYPLLGWCNIWTAPVPAQSWKHNESCGWVKERVARCNAACRWLSSSQSSILSIWIVMAPWNQDLASGLCLHQPFKGCCFWQKTLHFPFYTKTKIFKQRLIFHRINQLSVQQLRLFCWCVLMAGCIWMIYLCIACVFSCIRHFLIWRDFWQSSLLLTPCRWQPTN